MRAEFPPIGAPDRTILYKEDGEIPSRTSRLTFVFGTGKVNTGLAIPDSDLGVSALETFLLPGAITVAHEAAQHVLEEVVRQKEKEETARKVREPMRDVMNTGNVPLRRIEQLAIGDTVILLGGTQGLEEVPESFALLGSMLKEVPDLLQMRGVEVHVEQSKRPSIFTSVEFIQKIIKENVSLAQGREIDSTALYCPPDRAREILLQLKRAGIRVDNIAKYY